MTALNMNDLQQLGYRWVRQLSDGTWIGITDLLYTTAICIDLNAEGYESRYCFKNPIDALNQFFDMEHIDSEVVGFIAQRPASATD